MKSAAYEMQHGNALLFVRLGREEMFPPVSPISPMGPLSPMGPSPIAVPSIAGGRSVAGCAGTAGYSAGTSWTSSITTPLKPLPGEIWAV